MFALPVILNARRSSFKPMLECHESAARCPNGCPVGLAGINSKAMPVLGAYSRLHLAWFSNGINQFAIDPEIHFTGHMHEKLIHIWMPVVGYFGVRFAKAKLGLELALPVEHDLGKIADK
jgi:hypothetical protein